MLPLPVRFMAGFARGKGTGMQIREEGVLPQETPLGCGQRPRAECGQGVPSMMKVLDLEELNGLPGDKREI